MATQLPDAGDVPVVSPRTGNVGTLRVPQTPSSGLETLAQGAQNLANAQLRIDARRQVIQRDDAENEFTRFVDEDRRAVEGNDGFGVVGAPEGHAERIRAKQAELTARLDGDEVIANTLQAITLSSIDKSAVAGAAAENKRLDGIIGKRNDALVARITNDPDVFSSPDIKVPLKKHLDSIDLEVAAMFPGVSNSLKAKAVREGLRETAVESVLSVLIKNEDFDRARELLVREDLQSDVSAEFRLKAAIRLNDAAKDKDDAAVEELFAVAKAISPPGSTNDEIRETARELKLGNDANNTAITRVGNTIIVQDSNTGSVLQRIQAETPEQIEAAAKAKKAGELAASQELMDTILSDAGLEPITVESEDGTQVDPPAIAEPLDGGVESTEDFRKVARLMATAKKLGDAGLRDEARFFITQANALMSNSQEIAQAQELDKPISAQLAKELQVPVGTKLREVQDRIPPTVGDASFERGRGAKLGSESVKADEQIVFIDEIIEPLKRLLAAAEKDPTILGAVGSLRAVGQNALSIIGDLGLNSFVNSAMAIALTDGEEDGKDFSASTFFELFQDPKLSVLDILENSLGVKSARLGVPQGRVPVEVIRAEIKNNQLTGLKGSPVIINRIKENIGRLQTRRDNLVSRFPGSPFAKKEDAGINMDDFVPGVTLDQLQVLSPEKRELFRKPEGK